MDKRGKSVVALLLGVASFTLIWAQLSRTDTAVHVFGIAVFAFPGLLVMLTGRVAAGIGLVVMLVAALHLWGWTAGVVPFVVGVILVPLVVVSVMHAAESES